MNYAKKNGGKRTVCTHHKEYSSSPKPQGVLQLSKSTVQSSLSAALFQQVPSIIQYEAFCIVPFKAFAHLLLSIAKSRKLLSLTTQYLNREVQLNSNHGSELILELAIELLNGFTFCNLFEQNVQRMSST